MPLQKCVCQARGSQRQNDPGVIRRGARWLVRVRHAHQNVFLEWKGAVVLTHLGNVGVVTDEQGNFWWVARGVADILNISDPQTIIERLDEDEHGKTVIIDSMGWGQPSPNHHG